jgi:toxin-antitoxin system PIN domain toxin
MGQGTIKRLSVTRLLDINVLLALAWPQHIHHARVGRWISLQKSKGEISFATCPLTELGFVRISMNLKGYAADFQSAVGLLEYLVKRKDLNHCFWEDDLSVSSIASRFKANLGPNQLTDGYLASLAASRQGILTTLDAGIKSQSAELVPT